MTFRFRDRAEAGRQLATMLHTYGGTSGLLVLGLARGGIPVAAVLAHILGAPLDVFVVRKLGLPDHEELAMGAIASGGVRVINQEIVDRFGVSGEILEQVAVRERAELERREHAYRGGRPPLDPCGKVVIVADDGLATGATMRAAVAALRQQGAARIVVAAPVGAPGTCAKLRGEADDIVCVCTPPDFESVGQFYECFSQTSDAEVCALLKAPT